MFQAGRVLLLRKVCRAGEVWGAGTREARAQTWVAGRVLSAGRV